MRFLLGYPDQQKYSGGINCLNQCWIFQFEVWRLYCGSLLCWKTNSQPIFTHPQPFSWSSSPREAWSCRSKATDGNFIFLPFLRNRTNSFSLPTKLLADGLLAHSSHVQGCNHVPDVLWQIFGLAYVGRVAGMEEIDSVDMFALYT